MKNRIFYIRIVFVISGILVFLMAGFAARAQAKLIINEIIYDLEGSDAGYEWIEIKNILDGPIDLTGWKFYDGSNHLLNIPQKWRAGFDDYSAARLCDFG